ncbi:MAG: hypothetical protein HGB00_08680 [Chlorobiaceae bacterium]|nr:hypothetical protein [Chlorobiaceae bacterium]
MNNNIHPPRGFRPSVSWKAITPFAVAAAMLTSAQEVQANPSQEANWYISAGAQQIIDASGSGPDIDFGNSVSVKGNSSYDGEQALNIAVGREFNLSNDSRRSPNMRVEVQYWDGSVHRKHVDLGVVSVNLNDRIDLRALFLNGFIRLAKGDNSRLWFGPGIGYAWTSFPDASYATPCGCLKAADSAGLALQLKLQGERMVSEKTSIFGEVGYVNFQGADSDGGVPSAHYGNLGMTTVGIGVITRF